MGDAKRTEARSNRLADRTKRLTNNAMVSTYITAVREEEYNEYRARGSKYLADGATVIVENDDADKREDDPRVPIGFGNPFYQVNHVEGLFQISTRPSTLTALSQVAVESFSSPWQQINGVGKLGFGGQSVMRAQIVSLMNASPHKIIRFVCESCTGAHQEIYYKRLTGVPSNMVDIIETSWTSTNNRFNIDFKLYSTYENALDDVLHWQYCGGFDENGVGFPGFCGPTQEVLNQYANFQTRVQPDVGYYVEKADGDFATFAMTQEEKDMVALRQFQPEVAKESSICNYLPKLDDRLTCMRSCAYGERSDNKSALKLCRFKQIESQLWKTKETTAQLESIDGTERGKIIKQTHPLGSDEGMPGKYATF